MGGYSSKAVANWFLTKFRQEGGTCTQLEINKLVFIAHGWHLGVFNTDLIDEPVIAWKYGPVIPSLRIEFRDYGSSPITQLALDEFGFAPILTESDITKHESDLLLWIWHKYGPLNPSQLISVTHREGSPWAVATKNGTDVGYNKVIPNDLIRSYYSKLVEQLNEQRLGQR